MKLKLTCHEVSHLLSQAQDADLSAGERARLRLHMVLCDACRNVERQLAFLRRAMRGLGPGEDTPSR